MFNLGLIRHPRFRLQAVLLSSVAACLRQRRQDLRQRVRAEVEGLLRQDRRRRGARRRVPDGRRDDDAGA